MESGIYCWHNTINGKRYIGSAADVEIRKKKHVRLLDRGKHHSIHFQRAWDLYGEKAFIFEIIEVCDLEHLIQREQDAIDRFDAVRNGYNVAYTAGRPMAGRRHTAETKSKMSVDRKGKSKPKGFGIVISEARKGMKFGSEPNKKAWEARRKRPVSDKEKSARLQAAKHLAETNISQQRRQATSQRTSERWKTGQFDNLRELNRKRLKSDAHKKIVSSGASMWNKKRTAEFNLWCSRKAQAAKMGIEFTEAKPQIYRE